MRSTRITPAIVRDGRRMRLRETSLPTLSEDGTLTLAVKLRSARAVRIRRGWTVPGVFRSAGRRLLRLLGLL